MSWSVEVVFALLLVAIGPSWVDGNKIYQGREVDPNSRPWQAWIRIGDKRVKCGGALIHRKYVLTAASCVGQPITSIVLGDHSRSTDEGTEQIFNASSITPYPDYNHTSGDYLNDLAIIELDGRANVNGDAVSVIPVLPADHLADRIYEKHCRVCGWGYEFLGSASSVKDQSDVLLEYTADVTRRRDCIDSGAPSTTTVCYSPFRNQDSITCQGDVGGPMICKRKRVWNLAGVISGFDSSDGCMAGLKAATQVTLFNDWINSVIDA